MIKSKSIAHGCWQIVDFIIWLLFSRERISSKRPNHLLCDGSRRKTDSSRQGAPASIQGLSSLYFNGRVAAVKREPWPQLLALLGKSGEIIMINLLLSCSVFLHIDAGHGNYYQLSGECSRDETPLDQIANERVGAPIFDCEPLSSLSMPRTKARDKAQSLFERKPTEITFMRSRMLYARAALNARGLVHFGLRRIRKLHSCEGS